MSAGRKPALTAAHVDSVRRPMPELAMPEGMTEMTDADYRALRDRLLQRHPPGEDLLIFAYGSLIWNPACAMSEQVPATLTGWHRSFCFRITRYRGCDEVPGLMLSLDRGGSCKGVIQRLPAPEAAERLELVLRREQFWIPSSHKPVWLTVSSEGRKLPAIGYVIDRHARNYTPGLNEEQKADMIAAACGHRGPCAEYLLNTVEHLEALGIHDPYLWRLQELVAERIARIG
jgi:cation transport protein ChaC